MFRLTQAPELADETFETEEAAEAAVAELYGWAEVFTSDYFTVTVGFGTAEAMACYPSQEECDEDADDGAYAPRIIEMVASTYRAAIWTSEDGQADMVMTAQEDAHRRSDVALLALGRREATEQELDPDLVEIGEWTAA
jgi:hypothetical protein